MVDVAATARQAAPSRALRWSLAGVAVAAGVVVTLAWPAKVQLTRTWADDWRRLVRDAPTVEPGHRFVYTAWTEAGERELELEVLDGGRGSATFGVLEAEGPRVAFRLPLVPDLRHHVELAGVDLERRDRDVSPVGEDLEEVSTPAGSFRCGRVRTSGFAQGVYTRVDAWWAPALPVPVRVWSRPGSTPVDLAPPGAGRPAPAGSTLHELRSHAPGSARSEDELMELYRAEAEARAAPGRR